MLFNKLRLTVHIKKTTWCGREMDSPGPDLCPICYTCSQTGLEELSTKYILGSLVDSAYFLFFFFLSFFGGYYSVQF